MIYNSFNFLVIFPLIFILYYAIPAKNKNARNVFLLTVSYLLYINWTPVYALILAFVTFVTYGCAIKLKNSKRPKVLLVLGILISLLPLLFFKYFTFVNESIRDLLSLVGLRCRLAGLNWAIPVGISFYTFQALGYFWDVYYKRINAEKDILTYALFVSFFPSILSGPINKASLVIPQIRNLRPYFDYKRAVLDNILVFRHGTSSFLQFASFSSSILPFFTVDGKCFLFHTNLFGLCRLLFYGYWCWKNFRFRINREFQKTLFLC